MSDQSLIHIKACTPLEKTLKLEPFKLKSDINFRF